MTRPAVVMLALAAAIVLGGGCGKKSGPTAPVVHPLAIHSGDLVVTDTDGHGVGRIVVIDSAGVQSIAASGGYLQYPAGLAFASNGDLVVAEQIGPSGNGGVYRISRGGGAQTVVSAGGMVRNPTGVAVDAQDNIYVPCSVPDTVFGGSGSGTAGTVARISTAGAVNVLTATPLTVTYGIALESAGTVLINTGIAPAAVIRVNPSTHGQSTVSSGGSLMPFLLGLALDGSGNILVAGDASGVVRVNAANGTQAVVSTGGSFQTPFGIALDRNGKVLVADAGGGVLRVDPATGAQTTVSWGGLLVAPTAVAVVP